MERYGTFDKHSDAKCISWFFKNKFDRIYVINLAERVDRKKQIASELKRVGLDLTSDTELFNAIRPQGKLAFPGLGVLGCYLSHLSVLKMARSEGREKILIIEDDLMISRRMPRVVGQLSQQMDAIGWDVLLLGFFPSRGLSSSMYYGNVEDADFYSSVVLKKPPFLPAGMHFYAVNGRILDRLIAFLEHALEVRSKGAIPSANGMDIAYMDDAFYMFSEDNPDVVYLMAQPTLGLQRYTRSGVESGGWHNSLFSNYKNRLKTGIKKALDSYCPGVLSKSVNESISGVIPLAIHSLVHK